MRPALFGWDIKSPGWLSSSTQFIGTIAFNFNTFDALPNPEGWLMQNAVIWVPGMIGSTLFLVSAYLAYIETTHAHTVRPRHELAWWIVTINLVGCIAFIDRVNDRLRAAWRRSRLDAEWFERQSLAWRVLLFHRGCALQGRARHAAH